MNFDGRFKFGEDQGADWSNVSPNFQGENK